jgi:hypothetical protein
MGCSSVHVLVFGDEMLKASSVMYAAKGESVSGRFLEAITTWSAVSALIT